MSDKQVQEGSKAPQTVIDFVNQCAQLFKLEDATRHLRATPQGLFVAQDFITAFTETYRQWLCRLASAVVEKSASKLQRRLFGSSEPELFYLVEQKACLLGHLVPLSISQPQHLGLPFYLGSLDSAEKMLHPKDPLFQSLPNLQLQTSSQQIVYRLQLASGSVAFSAHSLEQFSRCLAALPAVYKEMKGKPLCVREALLLFVEHLQRARAWEAKSRLLVPLSFKDEKRFKFLKQQALIWVLDQNKGEVKQVYALHGKGLLRFMDDELRQLRIDFSRQKGQQSSSSFRYAKKGEKHVGAFHIAGKVFPLSSQAFVDFVQAIRYERKPSTKAIFTVEDSLREIIDYFMKSDRIEFSKIARHVGHLRLRQAQYRIFERWVFVLNPDNVILYCIDRSQSK